MMRVVAMLGLLALMAGCGADGAPVQPEYEAQAGGVTISGDARIGVTGGV